MQTKLDQAIKREIIHKSQIDELRKELLQIEKSYERREQTYILESKNYLDQIQKYQQMIADTKIKAIQKLDSEHYDMSKKLKKEIEGLRKQIKVKDDIINQLKDIENSDKRKERKDIRKILNKFKEVITNCETQIKNYVRDQPNLNQMLLDLNSKHNKAEGEMMKQLAVAREELYSQQEKMREISEQDYQEIIKELEHKLIVANNELDHAKRNLIEYINSLNSLEDIIKDSQEDGIGENEEIERLRLENHRLNEENASLITSKRQMDKHYVTEIERLKRENQSYKSEVTSISREYDKLSLTIGSVYKNLEIWRDREQIIRENYDRMEHKLNTALQLKKKGKDFDKSEAVIRSEEESALKEEHKKMEKLLQLSQDKWNEEKATLNEEIFSLRNRIDKAEDYFNEVSDKMTQELKTFKETRLAIANQSEELMLRIQETDMLFKRLSEEHERSENEQASKDQELVVALGDDIAFLKNKLREEQDQHDNQLKELNKAYEEKLMAQMLREEALTKQVDELKAELRDTEETFESYKYLNQKEINNMISELNTLRRHSNVRQDQVQRREKKLKDEITKLKRQLDGR